MHIPYEEKLKHKADFRVKYKFLSKKENGEFYTRFQGYKSDFWYEQEIYESNKSVFMIWPEFEDENGNIILDISKPIEKEGTARMWILMNKMRTFHQENIKIGLKGFFREGINRTVECIIIEIIDLYKNPTE